jgi:hypothetical protein
LIYGADLDGEFLTAIAEMPNEILKCAMYLFLCYLDGATQFAQSCGGGGSARYAGAAKKMKTTAASPTAA